MKSAAASAELVPLADRQRYMQALRLAVALCVTALALASARSVAVPRIDLLLTTGAYAGVTAAVYLVLRLLRRRGLLLFGGMLLLDAVYLAWAAYATGGATSPVRYLPIVHLIAVALLASYRTGLKLALWHSMLLWVVYYAEKGGMLSAHVGRLTSAEMAGFAGGFWFVAIATASFSAVNERELRRRRYDLEALALMARRLDDVSEPLEVGDVVLESICDVFDFERAVLLTERDGRLTALSHRGETRTPGDAHVPGDASTLGRARAERRTLLVSDLDPVTDAWLAGVLPGARNLVVAPLTAEGQGVGMIVAEHGLRTGSRIERRVVSMVERFASHGALALRNAWLLEQLRRMAATDGLTGVANRATFDRTLSRELNRASRSGEDVALVMLDVDHFKRVNDAHGHQTGDDVLRRVAATLEEASREYDTVSRYGGEEFAVILPRTTPADSEMVAERLRHAVEACEGEPRVTASAGVASYPLDAASAEALLAAADAALYASKGAGRNKVTRAPRAAGGEASPGLTLLPEQAAG